jgi:adenosine deaminase
VPTALATDDLGVSRSDMTHEYLRAVLDQRLTYRDLKAMARASVRHAFLPEREKKELGQRLEKAFAAFERSF